MEYLLLVIGLVILLAGGKYLVDGASGLAVKFGLSPGLIGLTIVAFGTSAPELLVSINAALRGTSDIALGNVVGSNISNISLVLGISAVLYPIAIRMSTIRLDYLFTVLTAILFYLIALDGQISRIEGGILVGLLIALNFYFFKKLKVVDESLEGEVDFGTLKTTPLWKSSLVFAVGVLGLYFGSDLLVGNAVIISQSLGISERVIGVTIIAIGTSLPELVTSIIAALKKETDIAIGNILGSNIMNILAIIGITASIQPISVGDIFLQKDFLWMIGITLLLFPLLKRKLRLSKLEGVILLFVYGAYLYTIL